MQTISRRQVVGAACASVLVGGLPWAHAQDVERIGILMLHGKNPAAPTAPVFAPQKRLFEQEGWLVQLPDMPWSYNRYLDGNWAQAMAEIATHVHSLRSQGATRIVLVGHSMGAPAAMGFAAGGGDVQALVLLAPGHIPKGYDEWPGLKPVHDSIAQARALVAEGKGDVRERFTDINQGRQLTAVTTAQHYLSYFDPTSDAEMSVTAPKLPAQLPVLTVVGEKDPLFTRLRAYYVDSLPANPHTQYLEVPGGHLDTPRIAHEAVVRWIQSAVQTAVKP